MTFIRLFSDKQLCSALRILNPFNHSVWIKYRYIGQLRPEMPSQEGAAKSSPVNDLADSNSPLTT